MADTADVVIVGGGIAGLYAAYRLLRDQPDLRVVVLERTPGPIARAVGGRIQTLRFAGMDLPCGAGIGRTAKDRRLAELLATFGLPSAPFTFRAHYPHEAPAGAADAPERRLLGYLARLRGAFRPERDRRRTFRVFATEALGSAAAYDDLTALLGYTDYEREDAYETMRHYGLDDNYGTYDGFSVPWRGLRDAFVRAIGARRIRTGVAVTSVVPAPASGARGARGAAPVVVHTTTIGGVVGTIVARSAVILALPAKALRELFPAVPAYRGIFGQPFLRVYAQFAPAARPILASAFPAYSVLTRGPSDVRSLQKIIPIAPDRGVYMIAYADNANAERHRDRLTDTAEHRAYWERLVAAAIGAAAALPKGSLQRLAACYWPVGTHAYAPLPTEYASRRAFLADAQRPLGRAVPVYAASEAVSRDQGWTHGALAAVDAIFPSLQRQFSRTTRAAKK